MARFSCIATDLPVGPLVEKLGQHPLLWKDITARQDAPGSPHVDTECIVLRWPADQSVWASFYDLTCIDYPASELLMPEVGALMLAVLNALGLEASRVDVGRMLIVSLKPGGHVRRHLDEGPYADKYDRFHVVLQPGDESLFLVEGHPQVSGQGDLFWFNHKCTHEARNRGTQARWHLIIDLVSPSWRAQRGLTFQRERAIDLWEEILPLLVQHKAEIAHYPDIVLDPDIPTYEALDAQGHLRAYTARSGGKLVGYAVFFVRYNMHYRQSLQALQDVLFVDLAVRHGRVGLRLIEYAEDRLRDDGVQVILHHVKVNTPATVQLFLRLGYEPIDQILGKRLDR